MGSSALRSKDRQKASTPKIVICFHAFVSAVQKKLTEKLTTANLASSRRFYEKALTVAEAKKFFGTWMLLTHSHSKPTPKLKDVFPLLKTQGALGRNRYQAIHSSVLLSHDDIANLCAIIHQNSCQVGHLILMYHLMNSLFLTRSQKNRTRFDSSYGVCSHCSDQVHG